MIAAIRAAMAGGPFFCPRNEDKKRAGVSPSAKPSPKDALAGVRPQDDAGFFGYKKSRNDWRDLKRQWPGAPFSARGTRAKKGPAASYSRTGGSRTTLGDGALDFSVRNGNWYFCPSMATGMKAVESED